MPAWNAFGEMDALRREIDRAFSEFWPGRGRVPRVAFLPGRGARQYPLVNVSEDDRNVYVEALAPGVDPKSLDLSVMEGALTITGEKPGLAQVSAEAYHRNERAAGRFVRTVELPVAVDAGKVSADYRTGLLLVTLPKAESARPRQVPITVG
ncbi:MAG: Hsp20/alpha crystallin family protein [Zetaproteobacteria bacterium]|nr:MAG: Hsp20/alpha crystallin family protein [Zetaproteobacteria bacterium]